MSRVVLEQQFWNRVIEIGEPYIFTDEFEEAHIIALLGDLHDRDVLECGCGFGVWTVNLAKRGARVWTFDVSERSIEAMHRRAQIHGVADRIQAAIMDLEHLAFQDAAFDLAFGSMILHHVDPKKAGYELSRVLKPGGKAVFHENSANNSVLMLCRRFLVGRWGIPKYGTKDEYPLTRSQIEEMGQHFFRFHIHVKRMVFFHLVSKYLFKERKRRFHHLCILVDRLLYQAAPFLHNYSYQQIVEFVK